MIETFATHFNKLWLSALLRNRNFSVRNIFNGSEYSARIVIPDYRRRIEEHYKDILKGSVAAFCQRVKIPFTFSHFGLEIEFEKATELVLHSSNMIAEECLKNILGVVGPVMIINAYHHDSVRSVGHRNRFPHLNFHIDRSENQPDHYSMYSRDPFDDEQKNPRTVSTLMCANIVGYLQSMKEEKTNFVCMQGMKTNYTIFSEENMDDIFDSLVLEKKWNAPCGVGEIAMQDNLTCLHASYYYNQVVKGYKIGVRYLE